MKLLTLNTHSLLEENYPQKLSAFADAIAAELPDVIALQEVNQTADAPAVDASALADYTPCTDRAVIRADNHVYNAARLLLARGIRYRWSWLPIKRGYGRFDEGIALMSLRPIRKVDRLTVSRTDDFQSWKTRKILGICTEDAPDEWFFSVHYGFWDDPDEPFSKEWQKTAAHMAHHDRVLLMGDFNSPVDRKGEGYDLIAEGGWLDTYALARQKDSGITVGAPIDGWTDSAEAMRIDQIWTNHPIRVNESRVIFNGANYPVISDHFGVMIEVERRRL